MTDKPNTLSLDGNEWRALIGENLNRATQFVQANQQLSAEHLKAFHDHMDRVKSLISAWHLSAPAMNAGEAQQREAEAPKPNGAAPKKGGWPKGKKRNAPANAGVQ